VKGGTKIEAAVFKELKTGKEKEIKLDGLFLEIGAMPGTELTKGCGIKTDADGYIMVNQKQETSCPGVYAAGDVTGRLKQISVATGDAAVAVMSIKEYLKK
jgi:thioredoxin reductase (NADPH)